MTQKYLITGPLAKESICKRVWEAQEGTAIVFRDSDRTLEQNAAQWPILDSFAKQLQGPVNGKLQQISSEDWKDILTAAFRQEQVRVAQGLDGGMVLLGHRTSKFTKREFSDWLEFLNATAADRGVDLGVAA